MQPREHGRGHIRGRENPDPRGDLESGIELAQGRQLGERSRAFLPRDGEPAQAPGLDVRGHRIPAEHHRDLSREQGHRRRSASLVRHVHELDARARLEHFHGEMVLAAVADRRVSERRPRALRQVHEIPQVLDRQGRIDRQHHLRGDEGGHGR